VTRQSPLCHSGEPFDFAQGDARIVPSDSRFWTSSPRARVDARRCEAGQNDNESARIFLTKKDWCIFSRLTFEKTHQPLTLGRAREELSSLADSGVYRNTLGAERAFLLRPGVQ